MNTLAADLQRAIAYIEGNLDGELNIRDIAARALISPFHFQRMFNALCGVTVGEYIRSRRLTVAAQELSATDAKVIDVAVKYGYESPDSFARAFQRFHGILPSQAREKGAALRSFAPMHIRLSLEGGSIMEYRIVEKAAFTVAGLRRTFAGETSYQEIPRFWDEFLSREDRPVKGVFGVCLDSDGKRFDYLIADLYDPRADLPAGCEARQFPAGTWAVFPCRGDLPDALQSVNTRIWSEWLPASREYRLAGDYNLEVYWPVEERYCEIWVPVELI